MSPAFNIVHKFHGRFKFTAVRIDKETGQEHKTDLTGWFDNLIVDTGLEYVSATPGNAILGACAVGTGSTAPANGDSSLNAQLAITNNSTSDTQSIVAGPPSYGSRVTVWRFAQGAAAGNITEVGVFSAVSSGTMWSRALILDGTGAPTTITVTSIDFLDVTYELREYIPTGDFTGSVTINGVVTAFTGRPAANTNVNMWAANIPSTLLGGGALGTPPGTRTYGGTLGAESAFPSTPYTQKDMYNGGISWVRVGGQYAIDFTGNYGINDSNATITCIAYWTYTGAFQYALTPPIVKDNTQTLALTFRHTLARYP